jgi:hypothetical protein
MALALRLVQDLIEVEAGSSSPVTITLTNKGESQDRYELEIEGVDPEWKAIPVPTFTAEPGEEHSERFFIKPPRSSESIAGNYPFVVRVRSLESGEQKTVQGTIRLKPYHHLTMEIDPKKGLFSPTVHRNEFEVTIVNLGNTEHTLHLGGTDPEDSCTYEFEQDQVTLAPGQQKEVALTVRPTSTRILSSGKLIGFSITGRSVDVPSVVTTAQAQLEQRSLISPSTLAFAVFIVFIVGLWLLMRPKTPGIQVNANPMSMVTGQSATITWTAHDASHIVITASMPSGQQVPLYDGADMTGSETLPVNEAGQVTILANVYREAVQGTPDRKTINVTAPPPVIPPTITAFSSSNPSHTIARGASVTFKWSVDNATSVDIAPYVTGLDPVLGSYQVNFKDAGPQDVYLVAHSKDGGTATSKKWHVNVVDESDAKILSFTATPDTVDPGNTSILKWTVTNAALVELKPQTGTGGGAVDLVGSQAFQITGKTVFLLTATDSQGRATVKKVVVNLTPPKPQANPTPTTSGATTTTTAPADTGNPTQPPTDTATTATTGGQ